MAELAIVALVLLWVLGSLFAISALDVQSPLDIVLLVMLWPLIALGGLVVLILGLASQQER